MAKNWAVGIGLAGLFILGFLGYRQIRQQPRSPVPEGTLTVGATIFPLADIVHQVGGDAVNVVLVIPPGVSEHANVLTPQQLEELQGARVLFGIGSGLDNHLSDKIVRAVAGIQAVTVDRGIALREKDPHYYLTVPNAMHIVQTVAEELSRLDPEHSPAYAGRLAAYERQLAELETDLQAQAKAAPRQEFIAMHNAWSYFADHYGFRLVGTYEPREGQEPSLADLVSLGDLVRRHNLTTFYAEPQKSTSAVTAFMKREFGLTVLTLDPVGGQTGKESYVDLMRANMAALVNAG